VAGALGGSVNVVETGWMNQRNGILQSLDYRFPCLAWYESVLYVDIIWKKIQFYHLPVEPVHISKLVGKDLHLLKFDYMIMVDTMFGYGQLVWLTAIVSVYEQVAGICSEQFMFATTVLVLKGQHRSVTWPGFQVL
jgi:hypothetical protein